MLLCASITTTVLRVQRHRASGSERSQCHRSFVKLNSSAEDFAKKNGIENRKSNRREPYGCETYLDQPFKGVLPRTSNYRGTPASARAQFR